MSDHPIESLMKTAMENIKEVVDINTVIGDTVETPDGSVIIPVSKVTAGFAAGGSEYETEVSSGGNKLQGSDSEFPFGGGSGAGVSVKPVGFLVSNGNGVRLLPVDGNAILDHLIDKAPKFLSQATGVFKQEDEDGGEITIKTKK